MVKESLTECSISCNNDLGFVCELFWINLRWLVYSQSTRKYSLKVLLFLKVLEYKYEYKHFLKVRVLSTDEYCKIGTRVPKYRSTEYFGPKPGVQPAPHPWEIKLTSVQPAPHPSWEMKFIQCATTPHPSWETKFTQCATSPSSPWDKVYKCATSPPIPPKDEVNLLCSGPLIPSER